MTKNGRGSLFCMQAVIWVSFCALASPSHMLQENTQALNWWIYVVKSPMMVAFLTLELQEALENITSKHLCSHEDETYFNAEI